METCAAKPLKLRCEGGLNRCRSEIKSCQAVMYKLLPYIWILFMVVLVASTVVASLRGRPKKAPKKKPNPDMEPTADPLAESEPVLDFGDELAQMDKK